MKTPLVKKAEMWQERLQQTNPMLERNDIIMNQALNARVPNMNFVYKKDREKLFGEIGKQSLEVWIEKEEHKNRWISIVCLVVYVKKFVIPELRDDGLSEIEIVKYIRDLGFVGASLEERDIFEEK